MMVLLIIVVLMRIINDFIIIKFVHINNIGITFYNAKLHTRVSYIS